MRSPSVASTTRPTRFGSLQRLAFAGLALSLFGVSSLKAADPDEVVAVFSSKRDDYLRVKLPDGTFKPETYVFGSGGNMAGTVNDFSIDNLKFVDVARLIEPSLKAQNYVNAKSRDPKLVDLLIMVYWGTTDGTRGNSSSPQYQIAQAMIPPPPMAPPPPPTGQGQPPSGGPATSAADNSALDQAYALISMANRERDRNDLQNARLLGFTSEYLHAKDFDGTPFQGLRQDVVDEVQENRYFVILLAFDFQTMLKTKQKKLLWQTRFSIPSRGSLFDKQLAEMARKASRFYGDDSNGLVRKPIGDGTVKIGAPTILDVEQK